MIVGSIGRERVVLNVPISLGVNVEKKNRSTNGGLNDPGKGNVIARTKTAKELSRFPGLRLVSKDSNVNCRSVGVGEQIVSSSYPEFSRLWSPF